MRRRGKSLLDRFWAKVDVRGPNECWSWLGATARGYGRINTNRFVMSAPQLSWELENSKPFPVGMDSAHSCNNPACVNPAHIEPQTRKKNIQYAADLGRLPRPKGPRKTHCKRGHKYTPQDFDRGHHRCRKCKNDQRRKVYASS